MIGKKVLLVDDSPTALMMGEMVLRGQRYTVCFARNGREAIESAAAEHPDVILMDVVMPEMNGYEACRRIRQQQATRGVPIIMVTSRGEEQSMDSGFRSGCSDYITKPINRTELLTKLRAYIGS